MRDKSEFVIENGILKKYNGPGGNVEIPDGVTGIDDYAFKWCLNLEAVISFQSSIWNMFPSLRNQL